MKTKILLLVTLLSTVCVSSQKIWTLKECVGHALENNIIIKQNKLNLAVSEANIKDAKGNFLPTVAGYYSNSLGIGPVINDTTNSRVGSTTSLSGYAQLGSELNIFNGFRNLNIKKQAYLNVERSKLDLLQIENNISLNVVNTYLNTLFAEENLLVAKTQSEISKKQIERAQSQFDAGVIPKGDLLNVQSTAANDLQRVVIEENNLNLALLQLSQLLQIPFQNFSVAPIDVSVSSPTLLYKDAALVYTQALKNRPEIENAKLNVENAAINIAIAKSYYKPTITGSYTLASNYYYDLKQPQNNVKVTRQLEELLNHDVSVAISIPIFNGFKTDVSVEKSKINKEISETMLANEKLQLQQAVEQAFLDTKAASKTYEVSLVSLSAQKEAFKNAQARYDYGTMTVFDFDQVRTKLVNAESTLIRAKYDYLFKTKVLKFYFGENITD